jgi:predicted metal-dependent phosphoesterase TrpH
MSTIDLHCHSTASDGKDTPEKIVQIAKSRGITLLSLTDHDTVDGLGAAEAEAKALSIKFVSGLELSVTYYHQSYHEGHDPIRLHLLGYGFNYHDPSLLQELQTNREYRRRRIVHIFEKINDFLKKEGKNLLDMERFRRFESTVDGTIGRPHLGQFLVQEEVVGTLQEAFDQYLERCYVPPRDISLAQGAELIRKAGGRAVLAHPAGDKNYSLLRVTSDRVKQHQYIRDMSPHLDGIECYYPAHDEDTSGFFRTLALEFGKIFAGGSDHHGGSRDYLGRVNIPDLVGYPFNTD